MKTIIVSLAFLICGSSVFSQQKEGDIEIKKGFGGIKLYQDGRVLKPKQALSVMQINPEAYKEFKRAKSNYDGAQVMGFIGGFMIGWPLGTAIAGGDPEWGLMAGGAGILLLSIPLNTGYSKHARQAVAIYNGGSDPTSKLPVSISITPYVGGARLTVRF